MCCVPLCITTLAQSHPLCKQVPTYLSMDEIWATFTIAFLLLITPFLSMHRKYPSSKDGVSNSINFSIICVAGILPCAVKRHEGESNPLRDHHAFAFALLFHPRPWSAITTDLALIVVPEHRVQDTQVVRLPISADAGHLTSLLSRSSRPMETRK